LKIVVLNRWLRSERQLSTGLFDEFDPGNASFARAAAYLTPLTAGEAPGDRTKGESASKAGEEGDSAMVKRSICSENERILITDCSLVEGFLTI
jgi:hypothetical protein